MAPSPLPNCQISNTPSCYYCKDMWSIHGAGPPNRSKDMIKVTVGSHLLPYTADDFLHIVVGTV